MVTLKEQLTDIVKKSKALKIIEEDEERDLGNIERFLNESVEVVCKKELDKVGDKNNAS